MEQVHTFDELLDAMGKMDDNGQLYESIRNAYKSLFPIMEMKNAGNWANGIQPGERIGKTDRNIAAAKEKSANPVTVRFHRTESGNVDAIKKNGLLRSNPHSGENTGDAHRREPVVWTADNPDAIPVLRRFDNDSPRYAKGIDTFKITMPKDKYNSMRRFAMPRGRYYGDIKEVSNGENSLSNEGDYKIDIFGEDIPKENLELMAKTMTPNDVAETRAFRDWRTTTGEDVPNKEQWNQIAWSDVKKLLPAALKHKAENSRSFASDFYIMNEIKQYIAKHDPKFDWDRYNTLIHNGFDYSDAARQASIGGNSDMPWISWYMTVPTFNNGMIGTPSDRFLDRMDNKKWATEKKYDFIKNTILNNDDSAVRAYIKDIIAFLWSGIPVDDSSYNKIYYLYKEYFDVTMFAIENKGYSNTVADWNKLWEEPILASEEGKSPKDKLAEYVSGLMNEFFTFMDKYRTTGIRDQGLSKNRILPEPTDKMKRVISQQLNRILKPILFKRYTQTDNGDMFAQDMYRQISNNWI